MTQAVRSMGVNGHAEGHSGGGGGDAPDANGTSQHYHVAEDDQTLEEVRDAGLNQTDNAGYCRT